jgi:hypothetical protein
MRLYARYLAGWAVVGTLLAFALVAVLPGIAGDAGQAGALTGVLLVAATDLVVFGLVVRALGADARAFAKLWGLSVAVKVFVFGSAIALVAGARWFAVDGFVRVLIVSFVVFAHHEILQLALAGPVLGRRATSGS